MKHSSLELVYRALEHPHGHEILGAAVRLLSVDMNGSFLKVTEPEVTHYLADNEIPRSSELQFKGVDTSSLELLQVAKEYPERLETAIDAWLRWTSYSKVKYPTKSLINAIRTNWK
jgi:hypothetical protein